MSPNVKTAILGACCLLFLGGIGAGVFFSAQRDREMKSELASNGIVHLFIKTSPNVSDISVYVEERLVNEYIERFKNPQKEIEYMIIETRGSSMYRAKETREYVSMCNRGIKYFTVTKLGDN